MPNEIIYSLKPEFINLIINKQKNHEFRNVKPKTWPTRIWFYISSPECKLMYIAEVGEVINQPNKILTEGIGNFEFNEGFKFANFAYPINHLYKIIEPIGLKELKQKFKFTAPQGFTYLTKYPDLYEEVINKIGIIKLF